MKTTIEAKGYQIVIEETENEISVTAIKDEETMEEFTLNLGEESEGYDDEKSNDDDDDIKSFDEFGDEEEDFDGEPSEKDGEDEESNQQDMNDDDDDDEIDEPKPNNGEPALESFQSFINRTKK